ncbi:diguanylate cyclase [Enterobacter cloacae]|uniref:diguanylate cyclase n=1 Tax=Enterobacter cloacae TaxID=550 RepID=A0A377M2C3_ENTCL|nr:diguanylate cyclase [Enterobacter cloacae]
MSKEEALAAWRKQAIQLAVLILIFTVALIVASYFLYSDLSRKTRDNKELKIIASEDALTGLFNRRTFDEKILSEIAACADNDTPISILIVDVDYFKKYNDNYGHQKETDALPYWGIASERALPATNQLVARYGGEEFAPDPARRRYSGSHPAWPRRSSAMYFHCILSMPLAPLDG